MTAQPLPDPPATARPRLETLMASLLWRLAVSRTARRAAASRPAGGRSLTRPNARAPIHQGFKAQPHPGRMRAFAGEHWRFRKGGSRRCTTAYFPPNTKLEIADVALVVCRMNTVVHPAHTFDFDELLEGLELARGLGHVHRRRDPGTGLSLFVYTPRCVFEDGWTKFTALARGLVLDEQRKRIVATPFPKFFNLGEARGETRELPFESFEKVDGSLIIAFQHQREWLTATKGAFDSAQALWARRQLKSTDLAALQPDTTYLFEAVSPDNRIVVKYDDEALVLLAAYDGSGRELSYGAIQETADRLPWRSAIRHSFLDLAELIAQAEHLPRNGEGFVIRYQDGHRLKLKGAEYCRIHALISRCTPLAMWEALVARKDMQAIRRDLPEEFWTDFDVIVGLLKTQLRAAEVRVTEAAAKVAHLSDRELGQSLATLPDDARGLLFGYRKQGLEGRVREALLRSIRPTGNELEGYTPSYAMGRMHEESMS